MNTMPGSARFDVIGIGNAIVDILSTAEDAFLAQEGIAKGAMTLIDASRAETLFDKMGTATTVSGGSAANTIAGLASLGGRGAYIGKVFADQLGAVFTHDMKALGVHYRTAPATDGLPTACCIILVTPDGQRSMNTFLGASTDFSAADLDEESIAASAITYLEGYLFDKPPAKEAFARAAALAHKHGRKVALTLSDSFCVDRHRDGFRKLVKEGTDIIFANEAEVCALYQTLVLDDALPQLAQDCALAVVTRSEKGSLILTGGRQVTVQAEKIGRVVDTTGAGDLYAAGFLYGLTHNHTMEECGRIASICAAEVISHIGPRPQENLRELVNGKVKLVA
jgi:sugar/nucleoside kinase (ribokinase family)